jgi:hypothetical protein
LCLPDPGQQPKAAGQRLGVGQLPAQPDPSGGVGVGGVKLVAFVQHLGHAHVRHAGMRRLAPGLAGRLQPPLVAGQRRA